MLGMDSRERIKRASMQIVRNVFRTPRAFGYWLGMGRASALEGEDLIFLCHGTPRSGAGGLSRQLRYLQRVFAIVPLAELAASIGAPRRGRRRAAIAFDDGLRSNVRVAYPILRALGVPAIFFVCPGLIEERRWLWTHEARRRLRFAGAGLRGELARQLGAPAGADAFVEWMKRLSFARRTRVEATLREATAAFVPSQREREAFDLAGWDELRQLDPTLVSVGSHTMTHPVLPSMSTAQIEAELRDSRRLIESRLAQPAQCFSYPNGDYDERTLAGVRRYYRAAISCAAVSSGDAAGADPHLMPNVPLPDGVLRLAWRLNQPPVH